MKYLRLYDTRSEYETNFQQSPFVGLIKDEGTLLYDADINDPANFPLCVTALEDLTVSFSTNAIEYSLDNATWNALPAATTTPTISAGSNVFFRASGLTATSSAGIGTFTISGKCEVGGNIMSMIYGDDFNNRLEVQPYSFYSLFKNGTNIVSACALVLPATTLGDSCYKLMFYGCTSLVNAPALPATTLEQNCYSHMFKSCTSLVNAPALPATTLKNHCYYEMFNGCTSLVNAPALPATTFGDMCYGGMFKNCTSLVNAPALPATTLKNSCYQQMFYGCTSLVNAPALPATTLEQNCYQQMFNGCTSLVNAPALPATSLNYNCYKLMFNGCTSLSYINAMFTTVPGTNYTDRWVTGVAATGTFVKNAAATWNVTGENGVPTGWTVVTAAS